MAINVFRIRMFIVYIYSSICIGARNQLSRVLLVSSVICRLHMLTLVWIVATARIWRMGRNRNRPSPSERNHLR